MNKKLLKNNYGFSLFEVLISLLVIMVLILGVYALIILSLRLTADNAAYVEATEIANQKMERIRNLSFDDVGTIAGNPAGLIPQNETIVRGYTFSVLTSVEYYDDPYDGVFPADNIWDDYKIATIDVSWQGKYGPKTVTVFSKIIPRTEEVPTGNGLLKILVVDANGNPVQGASVHIENNIVGPYVNNKLTDVNGEVTVSVLPAFESYEISISKAGYGREQTYPRTVSNPNPTKPHLSVVGGVKTEESFSIDLLSYLTINTITQDLPENWRVNTDASTEQQINSRLVIDPAGFIYLVWQDYRSAASSKIYAQKYDMSGNPQWLPADIVVSPANDQILPDILVDSDGNLFICWNDDSVGNQEAYLISLASSDGSDIWGGEKKLNTLSDPDDQGHARIALSNDSSGTTTVSVVWQDNRNAANDNDVYLFRYRGKDGTLLYSPEKLVNTNPSNDGTEQGEPVITSDAKGQLFIAWQDNRNGNFDVYAAKYSSTTIQLWEKNLANDALNTDQYSPDIAIDTNNSIVMSWTDKRNGDQDVYIQKYDNDGNPLWATDVRVNSDSSNTNQFQSTIAVDSTNNIFIVWTDERNGNQDIYAQKLDTNGNKLWTSDVRININVDNSAQYNPEVVINPFSNKPYASWDDERNGNTDIYITEFDVYGASSTIPNVPITVVGTKKIGENPVIYKYDISTTTNATGQITLQVEWDIPGYTANVINPPSTYNVIFSQPNMPVGILPNTNTNFFLYLE